MATVLDNVLYLIAIFMHDRPLHKTRLEQLPYSNLETEKDPTKSSSYRSVVERLLVMAALEQTNGTVHHISDAIQS
jgi:hypothetical protein